MNTDKIEDVMSELLGEGYRIVWEDGTLSPAIDWVDWIEDPEDEEKVEVTFQDGSTRTFDKGVPMRQIWHEDVDKIASPPYPGWRASTTCALSTKREIRNEWHRLGGCGKPLDRAGERRDAHARG